MKNRDKAYLRAVEEAEKEFVKRDPVVMAQASGTQYHSSHSQIQVPLMQEDYFIHYPSAQIEGGEKGEVSLPYRILLLHYLTMSRGLPVKGEWISFKEIPGGLVYYDAFYRRAVEPIQKIFGNRLGDLKQIGEDFGGEALDLGDVSFSIQILPKIPLAYILWAGDEELPPRASILFDESVKYFLPMEDLALLSSIPVWKMMGMAKKKG